MPRKNRKLRGAAAQAVNRRRTNLALGRHRLQITFNRYTLCAVCGVNVVTEHKEDEVREVTVGGWNVKLCPKHHTARVGTTVTLTGRLRFRELPPE